MVIFGVLCLVFLLIHLVPGDPVEVMLGESAQAADREALRQSLGLDKPLLSQFGSYLGNVVRFDLGTSLHSKRPILDILLERLPATLELVAVAFLISLLVGVPMGVYSALKPHSWLSHVFQTVSLNGISLPTFVTGILLILTFAVTLNWLPSFGRGEVVQIGGWSTGLLTLSGLKSLMLPGIMLGDMVTLRIMCTSGMR